MKKNEIPEGWKEAQFSPCACGSLRVIYQVVDSDAYNDECYKCTECGKVWWVEGSDY
jgi:uncharacterized Zn finger protein